VTFAADATGRERGDLVGAREQLEAPLAVNPRLSVFLERLADAGFLDHDEVAKLQ